ncbi:hypothetical protein [Aeromonas media]|uniref:hypothetical protein n=1 Tax=Aeromonas media TaxID=651 RepID=UPI00370C46D4
MKDKNDTGTLDMINTPKKRGRPVTGTAKSSAARQAAYRAKKAANTVTVTFNRDDIGALKLVLANPADGLGVDPQALDRIAQALFDAAL